MDDPGTRESEPPHPDLELDRLAAGRATAAQRRQAVRHLLEGCRRCGLRLVRSLGPEPVDGQALDAAVSRAVGGFSGIAAWVAAEKRAADEFVDRLRRLPKPHQRLLLTNSDRARGRAVVERLLEESRSHRGTDTPAAAHYAALAVVAAELCDEPEAPELQVRAIAERGNAHRILGDLAAAAADLAAAERLLRTSPVADPLVGAELLSYKASLATDQRRFAEAHEFLRRAASRYRRLDDPRGLARILVQTAYVATCSGATDKGIEPLQEAVEILADLDEPRLRLQANHNLACLLLDTGDALRAGQLLGRLRPFYSRFGTKSDQLRFDWLAARCEQALDRPERAAALLSALRVRYAQEKLPFESALVSLDLAVAHRQLGRRDQLAALAAETAEQLARLGVAREHLAALGLLAAAEAEQFGPLVAGLVAVIERRRSESAR